MWTKTDGIQELKEIENERIAARRDKAGIDKSLPHIGFALSGGGIRSATFCLGIFQALARLDRIREIDYLSTVSGGGYFGAFLGRLFTRDKMTHAAVRETLLARNKKAQTDSTKSPPGDGKEKPSDELKAIAWLRENGRYLSPNGGGDFILATSMMLRNWVATLVVMASLVLSALLLVHWIELGHIDRLVKTTNPALRVLFENRVPADGSRWWGSNWWPLPLLSFLLLTVPPGWAYWCVTEGEWTQKVAYSLQHRLLRRDKLFWVSPIVGLILATLLAVAAFNFYPTIYVFGLLGVTLATWLYLGISIFQVPPEASTASQTQDSKAAETDEKKDRFIFQDDHARHWLTVALRFGLAMTIALFILYLIDSLGKSLFLNIRRDGFTHFYSYISGLIIAGSGAVTMFIDRITAWLTARYKLETAALPLAWLALVAAVLLIGSVLVSLDALTYGLLWGFPDLKANINQVLETEGSYGALITAIFFSFSWLFGRNWSFLNRSSLHTLYSSRLARAYLGASNPERYRKPPEEAAVIDVVAGDDISMRSYYGAMKANGAPLHLINVTVNETVGGTSQVQRQDRKGFGLSVGPAGVCLGSTEKRILKEQYFLNVQDEKPHCGEEFECLSLGQWTAISGAAFSTGMGGQSSIGLSLLTGYFNLRLGFWWDACGWLKDGSRKTPLSWFATFFAWVFPVQGYLLNEYLGRFYGPTKDLWNLSDGGHFENLGAYELIRREVPIIFVVDAEADPKYEFEGLGNLVRKARIDFGAEITFFTEKELQALTPPVPTEIFGTLESLRKAAIYSSAYASIAEITFPSHPEKDPLRLVYIKAAIKGDEPLDIRNYHAGNKDFPQQTTADQFFDEAQWESYRKLGEYIGELVFEGYGPLATAHRQRPNGARQNGR